jgi:hypothetical protein
VEDVPDTNDMSIKEYLDGAYTSHWRVGVVGKGDIFGGQWCVGGESLVVWPHVICCPRVCDED